MVLILISVGVCSIRELYDFPVQCVCYWIMLVVMYVSLQGFENILRQNRWSLNC